MKMDEFVLLSLIERRTTFNDGDEQAVEHLINVLSMSLYSLINLTKKFILVVSVARNMLDFVMEGDGVQKGSWLIKPIVQRAKQVVFVQAHLPVWPSELWLVLKVDNRTMLPRHGEDCCDVVLLEMPRRR